MSARSPAPAEEPRPESLAALGDTLALLARLDGVLPQVDQERRPLSLLQLDIERFGEPDGDQERASGGEALQKLVDLLGTAAAREIGPDVDQPPAEAFRIGADEFVLILPRTGRLRARRFAAALLDDAVRERVPLRIGIGVAEPGAMELGDLLLAADGALRAARARGVGARGPVLPRVRGDGCSKNPSALRAPGLTPSDAPPPPRRGQREPPPT